jgi:hypothetical protein
MVPTPVSNSGGLGFDSRTGHQSYRISRFPPVVSCLTVTASPYWYHILTQLVHCCWRLATLALAKGGVRSTHIKTLRSETFSRTSGSQKYFGGKKIKPVPVLKHYAMKTYGGGVHVHIILTRELLGGVMLHASAASPPVTHCIWGWMGPRAGLNEVKRKFFTTPELELRPLGCPASRQPRTPNCSEHVRG